MHMRAGDVKELLIKWLDEGFGEEALTFDDTVLNPAVSYEYSVYLFTHIFSGFRLEKTIYSLPSLTSRHHVAHILHSQS